MTETNRMFRCCLGAVAALLLCASSAVAQDGSLSLGILHSVSSSAPPSVPTHVQGHSANLQGTPTSIPVTVSAVGAGDTVCVYVFDASGTSSPGTLTDNKTGNTYTSSATPATIFGGFGYVFVGANIQNAPTQLTYTTTEGASSNLSIIMDEFAGTATTSVVDGHVITSNFSVSGTNGNVTGNFTTTVNGDMVWGATISFTATMTAGTSSLTYTGSVADATNLLYSEYGVQTTASASTKSAFTPSVSTNAQVAGVGLKP